MTPRICISAFFAIIASGLLLPPPSVGAAEIPKVFLSEKHKTMCKVGVGDALPLKAQAGKQATVVAFVSKNGWMTRQLLKDLPLDVEKRFGKQGVALHVVRVGNAAPPTGKLPIIKDPDGKQLARVGEGALPRVYVLGAKNKIVWFDLEYTQSTRRELRQTLGELTGGKG